MQSDCPLPIGRCANPPWVRVMWVVVVVGGGGGSPTVEAYSQSLVMFNCMYTCMYGHVDM